MANRIESKVIAATGGSGAGAVLASFVLWLLGVTVWHVGFAADKAEQAVAAVPSPVAGLILLIVSALGALGAGYAAPHTSQPLSRETMIAIAQAGLADPATAPAAGQPKLTDLIPPIT